MRELGNCPVAEIAETLVSSVIFSFMEVLEDVEDVNECLTFPL